MKWLPVREKSGKKSEYGIVSDCGVYHIAKTLNDGVEKFMLWRNRDILGWWFTAAEAKQKAELTRMGGIVEKD